MHANCAAAEAPQRVDVVFLHAKESMRKMAECHAKLGARTCRPVCWHGLCLWFWQRPCDCIMDANGHAFTAGSWRNMLREAHMAQLGA